jgi:hypothetical protein
MSQAEFFFLKRGDKSFGPYSLAQIKGLSDQGKLKSTDFISKSGDGPWKKFGDVAANLFPVVTPSNAQELVAEEPSVADANGGAFANFDIGDLPPAIPPSNFNYAIPSKGNSRTHSEAEENEEAKDVGWKWIVAPWITENSNKKYGNLERYITISKLVIRFVFIIAIALVFLFVIGGLVSAVMGIIAPNADKIADGEISAYITAYRIVLLAVTLISLLILAPLMVLLIHLAYIAAMAGIDLLRLLIDTEENTRTRR